MAKSSDLRLLIIGAGASAWTQAGRLVGSTDLPISEAGLIAVTEEAQRCSNFQVGLILSGPSETSHKTAAIFAEQIGAKSKVLSDLEEMKLGLWEGKLLSELAEQNPSVHRQWVEDPASVLVPGGETIESASNRIISELCQVLEKTKDASSGIGVVLEPIARALVLSWIQANDLLQDELDLTADELPQTEQAGFWKRFPAGSPSGWYMISRDMIKKAKEQVRVGSQ